MSNTEITVIETGEGKFQQQITVGDHTFFSDEPSAMGGNDTGPSPYDFLLVSLGACTAMTLRMYANLKKIPLTKVSVRLKHSKIHSEDCVECETKDARLDYIERVIDLSGNLTQDQKEALLTIANKCPVHRTLTSEIVINTQLF